MSDRKAILLLVIICTGVLFLVFGDVIRYPNEYLFGIMGDSIKNYFTFAYYVKYDSGLHFSGMNHPWGEHIVYTDNQPLFSVPLGFIHRHIIALDQHIIGIVNTIVFGSMVASSVVLFFILRRCLLPAWYAIGGAILIVLLATQHFVISHQYALTNLLVLPAIWLSIIRLFEKPSNMSRYLVFVLVMLAAGLVHPYFLPMGGLLFLGCFIWFTFTIWFKKAPGRGKLAVLFFTGILPLLLFRVFLFFTDTVTDRPETPGGFLEGKTTIAGLFFPVGSLASYLLGLITGKPVPPEPNHGYIGLAALFCLLLLVVKAGRYLVKKDFGKVVNPVIPRLLQMALWAGLLLAVFSAAVPFRFGLMHWLDYIPPLKQFRVLSRFTWMFYFLFSVYGVFAIYQVYRYLGIKLNKILAICWLMFMGILWAADAIALLKPEIALLHKNKLAADFMGTEERVAELLKKINRKPEDFQKIMPVPYYSDGSEKMGYSNWKGTMYHSMKASYQTGLPISTASLARTSLTQVLLRTQLLSSDSIRKDILPLLHTDKPVLVIVTDSAEKEYEKRLVQKSNFLVKHKNVSYYELPVSRLKEVYTGPEVPEHEIGIPANVVYETFANKTPGKWLFNKGAFSAPMGPVIVFDSQLPQASSVSYQASVWINATALTGIANVWLEETDSNNQVVQKLTYHFRGATEIYKDWLRATIYFKLQNPENKIRITITGKGILADELLIRPVSQPVYYYTQDRKQLVRNNYVAY